MTVARSAGAAAGTGSLLVLYDADCGLCVAVVRRLHRWAREPNLEFLPLQAAAPDDRALVRSVAEGHPLHDELHVVDLDRGTVRSGGRAVVEITARLPGGALPAALGRLPPVAWAIGLGYALVARNRRAISRALRLDTVCRIQDR
ncbi:MAG: DUF393 domain-containing protein [Chloroflexi bacterium]|nr:DUF393 domain-containing protein [Chloroflexota bacterium]